jgi:hypothetical protein
MVALDKEQVMLMKKRFFSFLQLNKVIPQNLSFYLKAPKNKKGSILIEKSGCLERWPISQLETEMEIEYLPHLVFDHVRSLNHVLKICKKANKQEYVTGQMAWWGIYHQELLKSHAIAPVYLKYIDSIMEWGLFAYQDLPENCFIGEYTGTITKYKHSIHDTNGYCFEYSIGGEKKTPYTIDAKYGGNVTRFINHSFKPNLKQIPVFYDQMMHIIFKTNREVKKGEELTYNYGYSYWKKREKPLD